jgi:uncharacterized Zn finger protein
LTEIFPCCSDLPDDQECPTCGLRAAENIQAVATEEDDDVAERWQWRCMSCGQVWRTGRKLYD